MNGWQWQRGAYLFVYRDGLVVQYRISDDGVWPIIQLKQVAA